MLREANSHEEISVGFWPGSGTVAEPAFYAYTRPEPPGVASAAIRAAAAFYSRELGDFILPYDMVRSASSPDDVVLDFYQMYDAGAGLARWDRTALDRPSAEWGRDTGASDIPLAGRGASRHATLALPSHSGPWLTQPASDPLAMAWPPCTDRAQGSFLPKRVRKRVGI